MPAQPSSTAHPPPRLSVVVPLYNCLPLTQAMVASLQATLPAGLAHEIILVDDGSTDGTRDWLASLRAPFRVLLNERNLGYAAANNRAAAVAEGELLALLNNDLVLLPGWLEPMLAAHAELGAAAGVVGNVQLEARTGAVDHAGIVITHQGKPEHARQLPRRFFGGSPKVQRVPAVTGACFLTARSLWRELGGFDERFVNGGEDVDFCYRARAAGRAVVVALTSVIRHHVSSSAGRKLRDEENSFRLLDRWSSEFIADGARPWCRHYLHEIFVAEHRGEHGLALQSLCYLLGWSRRAPPGALLGLHAAQQREFERWSRQFGLHRPPAAGKPA